jgi:hypothetical protein
LQAQDGTTVSIMPATLSHHDNSANPQLSQLFAAAPMSEPPLAPPVDVWAAHICSGSSTPLSPERLPLWDAGSRAAKPKPRSGDPATGAESLRSPSRNKSEATQCSALWAAPVVCAEATTSGVALDTRKGPMPSFLVRHGIRHSSVGTSGASDANGETACLGDAQSAQASVRSSRSSVGAASGASASSRGSGKTSGSFAVDDVLRCLVEYLEDQAGVWEGPIAAAGFEAGPCRPPEPVLRLLEPAASACQGWVDDIIDGLLSDL